MAVKCAAVGVGCLACMSTGLRRFSSFLAVKNFLYSRTEARNLITASPPKLSEVTRLRRFCLDLFVFTSAGLPKIMGEGP